MTHHPEGLCWNPSINIDGSMRPTSTGIYGQRLRYALANIIDNIEWFEETRKNGGKTRQIQMRL